MGTLRSIYADGIVSDTNYTMADNRSQSREIYFKTGVVSRAAGSCYAENAGTKVTVAVYGPRQMPTSEFCALGKFKCDFKTTPFGAPSIRLENYPKSIIEVHVLCLQADGGAVPIATTCASLALADAGVELFDMVAACGVAHDAQGSILDPSSAEEAAADSSLLLSYMPSLNEMTQLVQRGSARHDEVQQDVELALDGCAKLHGLMREALLKKE